MTKKLKYVIPDSFLVSPFNLKLFKLMKEVPECFYDDFEIEAVYGCPGKCIWNGNRVNDHDYLLNDTIGIIETYNNLGLSYRFTFTNRLLEEKHMYDTYGNKIAEIGNRNKINGAITSTPVMRNHIEKNFPNLSIIESISTFYKTIEEVNEHSKDHIVVLPLKFINKFEDLSKLEHPENIEVLCNQPCPATVCPFNEKHYDSYNRYNLYEIPWKEVMPCYFKEHPEEKKNYKKEIILKKDIEKYQELKIGYFKIEGRDFSPNKVLGAYLEHFVRDEYKLLILNRLQTFTKEDWCWDSDFYSLYSPDNIKDMECFAKEMEKSLKK